MSGESLLDSSQHHRHVSTTMAKRDAEFNTKIRRYRQFQLDHEGRDPGNKNNASAREKELSQYKRNWKKELNGALAKQNSKYKPGSHRAIALASVGIHPTKKKIVELAGRLAQIESYKKKNPDKVVNGKVSIPYARNGFGKWAANQRCRKAAGTLSKANEDALNNVGFLFEPQLGDSDDDVEDDAEDDAEDDELYQGASFSLKITLS